MRGAANLTQQSENFGYSSVRLRRIVKLQFGIVDPNEMVRLNCGKAALCMFERVTMPVSPYFLPLQTWIGLGHLVYTCNYK